MRSVGWDILVLSFALLATAQVPKKCSPPPKYQNTRLDSKYTNRLKFSSGEKVYYSCDEDFTPISGIRAVQCNDGQWSKLGLKCERTCLLFLNWFNGAEVQLQPPGGQVGNLHVTLRRTEHEIPKPKLLDNIIIKERRCGNAGELPNGYFDYQGNSFIGEKVYAICNEGYTLKGLNYLICKKSGWTGELPSCEEGEVTCSAPTVANSVSSNASVYRVGDNITFTCSQGYQLDGAQQITCGPDGQWQTPLPQCLPSPQMTQKPVTETDRCGVPKTNSNSNANLADKYITKTSFASGDSVHYVCDVGYIQAGGSRYRRCIMGKWTPLLLRCERKSCGSAGEISNGLFTYTGVEFGDTATAVCDEGHHLVGRAKRHCMSQGWDGRVPVCEAITCDEPPQVANAEMTGRQEPPYTYRSAVRYQCRVGTLKGASEIWCTKNGTWSHPPPTCKEITCPPPKVPSAFWSGAQNGLYRYRDTIFIECNRGYKMSGPPTVTCDSDGRWYPSLPRCTRASRRTSWRQ